MKFFKVRTGTLTRQSSDQSHGKVVMSKWDLITLFLLSQTRDTILSFYPQNNRGWILILSNLLIQNIILQLRHFLYHTQRVFPSQNPVKEEKTVFQSERSQDVHYSWDIPCGYSCRPSAASWGLIYTVRRKYNKSYTHTK